MSDVNELTLEVIEIDELHEDPNNARDHEKGIPELVESLTQFGQQKPLVVWGNNVVIAGNGLMEAAIELGWSKIYISRVPSDWSYEKACAFALADNRTAELSSWKLPVVTKQLFELSGFEFNMPALGFANFNQPKRVSFDVTPQLAETGYAIIIDCDTEAQQAELLEKFAKQKLHARPLMT